MKRKTKEQNKEGTLIIAEKQHTGGTLTIPDGYAVLHVDLDAEIPICKIIKFGNKENDYKDDEQILEIPRALAYYLTTHHNGSNKFRSLLRLDAQRDLRNKIKDLLNNDIEIGR